MFSLLRRTRISPCRFTYCTRNIDAEVTQKMRDIEPFINAEVKSVLFLSPFRRKDRLAEKELRIRSGYKIRVFLDCIGSCQKPMTMREKVASKMIKESLTITKSASLSWSILTTGAVVAAHLHPIIAVPVVLVFVWYAVKTLCLDSPYKGIGCTYDTEEYHDRIREITVTSEMLSLYSQYRIQELYEYHKEQVEIEKSNRHLLRSLSGLVTEKRIRYYLENRSDRTSLRWYEGMFFQLIPLCIILSTLIIWN